MGMQENEKEWKRQKDERKGKILERKSPIKRENIKNTSRKWKRGKMENKKKEDDNKQTEFIGQKNAKSSFSLTSGLAN